MRALATNTHKFVTNQGIPGGSVIDYGGPELRQHAGLEGSRRTVLELRPLQPQLAGTLVQRRQVIGTTTEYIECKPPAAVPRRSTDSNGPTIDYNQMKGATYVDMSGSYKLARACRSISRSTTC
jgi:iron complex outermembrane receptor protein